MTARTAPPHSSPLGSIDMHTIIEYINTNKEWLFSGFGIFIFTGFIWFARRLITSNSAKSVVEPELKSQRKIHNNSSKPKKSVAIPLGLQTFSLVYGSRGQSKALTLKGTRVNAEVQITCQIINPYKAMFGANDYALNVLLPRFLTEARGILEMNSMTKLRDNRAEISGNILSQLSPQFEKLGVRLDSVTIGAIEKVESAI